MYSSLGINYQKLTLFCKAPISMMSLVVNAVFGVETDVSAIITGVDVGFWKGS